jgi:hypothetical protein
MPLVRILTAEPLSDLRLRLTLTDGSEIERDVGPLLRGPIFEKIRSDANEFSQVRVEDGALLWPNGADLCPDMVIWNGLPPDEESKLPPREPHQKLDSQR